MSVNCQTFFIAALLLSSGSSFGSELDLISLKENYNEMVVNIAVVYENDVDGSGCETGTGFLISNDGYVITSNHIRLNTEKDKYHTITDILGRVGEPIDCSKPAWGVFKMEFISSVQDQDAMLLKMKTDKLQKYVRTCDVTVVKDGESLFTLGFPLGLHLSPEKMHKDNAHGFNGMWQVQASFNKGNSGGPVFNKNGRLVGLIYGDLEDQNDIGYVIPLNHFKSLYDISGARMERCETTDGAQANDLCLPINVSHNINIVKSDHKSFVESQSEHYVRNYNSVPGYYISGFEWIAHSVNNAPKVIFSKDSSGASVALNALITSGPIIDQWRGWVSGTLVTEEVPIECK